MERESLLTVLTILLGGVALQLIGAWLSTRSRAKPGFELERAAWLRLWWPLTPALITRMWSLAFRYAGATSGLRGCRDCART